MFELKSFDWTFLPLIALHTILSMNDADCAKTNILFLAGVGSPSHHFWNREITSALAERGHNLTVISPRRDENPHGNVHYLQITGDYKKYYGNLFKPLSESAQRPTAWQDAISYQTFCAQTSGGKCHTHTRAQTLSPLKIR